MTAFIGVFIALLGLAAAQMAHAAALPADVVAMAEVASPSKGGRLAVFTADRVHPRSRRFLTWLEKAANELVVKDQVRLWDDVGAFDVCQLNPASREQTLLFVRPGGVYRLGDEQALASAETLFTQNRDDALPRVHICFNVFKGEPPALVVPTLAGVSVFRANGKGYALQAKLPAEADARFQWSGAREETMTVQRIVVRFEYPDVAAVDFNADGLIDLCMNQGESLICYLQDQQGFAASRHRRFSFDLLTEAELKDNNIRVESELIDLNGDHLPDLVLEKNNWNLSDMGTSLYVFLQNKQGGFAGKPVQTISRKGFFAYRDYVDIEGRGLPDLVAPVTALGWSDLVKIYLAKSADIDFLVYHNNGGMFNPEPRKLHQLSLPMEFKGISAVFGGLPLWDIKLGKPPAPGERFVAYVPGREAVEVYRVKGGDEELIWKTPASVGSQIIVTDLDGDGVSELVFAYPRDAAKAKHVELVDLKGAAK